MSDAKYDLGLVDGIKAEALGEPGQRTFRILLDGPGGEACLWLEKELLSRLAMAIRQVLTLPSTEKPSEETHRDPGTLHDRTSLEFRVGRLNLDHEPKGGLFQIQAHDDDDDDDDDDEPLLGFWASSSQLDGLAEEAMEVCAAGRPLCPLCSAPMGPEPHICPKTNGHSPLT